MDWIGLDWIGLGQKSYVSKFLQPCLFAQSFTGIPFYKFQSFLHNVH